MKFSKIIFASLLAAESLAFNNPIRRPAGADPFVTWSDDGYYYIMTTFPNMVQIARSETIGGLKTAEKKTIYQSDEPSRCCNVWAPEVHQLGDRWYVYFSAGNANGTDGQRPHVLEGGATPWDNFTYAGAVMDEWAIDGTILRTDAYGNYFVSSCMHDDRPQSLCIQKLNDDNISVSGTLGVISEPTETWEQSQVAINEGPAALYVDGMTHLGYSASFCFSPDYCIAMLTWDGRSDPLEATSWTKSDGCLLSSGNGHYGTGHNSFFASPDGTEHYIAYHATDNPNGACDDTRYAMIQNFTVRSDGGIFLGEPVEFDTEIAEPSH